MSYVLAKGSDGLAIYEPGNTNIGWVAWLISRQQEWQLPWPQYLGHCGTYGQANLQRYVRVHDTQVG